MRITSEDMVGENAFELDYQVKSHRMEMWCEFSVRFSSICSGGAKEKH